jgi:hypothetical protein
MAPEQRDLDPALGDARRTRRVFVRENAPRATGAPAADVG